MQFTKIKQKFISVVVEITTTGKDGKNRSLLCLPLRKLFDWLMTINAKQIPDSIQSNFGLDEYINGKGQLRPMYEKWESSK